jgi:hypothetical protein
MWQQSFVWESAWGLAMLYVVKKDGSEQLDFPEFQAVFRPKA